MEITGKIIKGIAGFYYVHDGHSRIFECKARGVFRKDDIKPLPGDEVDFEIVDDEKLIGNITFIHPRKNTLLRPAVTNIDQALLIFAMTEPEPSFNLIDRLLVYYKYNNIPVKIVFNKTDLVSSEQITKYSEIYSRSEVEIYFVSILEKEGVDLIKKILNEKTTVVTGPSGVGKSTFINYIIPEAEMETASISEKLKRGRHTTRHTEIFFVDHDTFVLDTPGFTSFYLEGIEPNELKNYYPEFSPYDEECKFEDCAHIREDVCGVKNATNIGQINKLRYDNYRLIYSELKSQRKY